MRVPLEQKTIATGYPLNSGLNQISTIFPIGGMYERLRLVFHYAITWGTGTPIVLGGYNAVKGINFKTDKNEVVSDNVPGLGFFPIDFRQDRALPTFIDPVGSSTPAKAVIDVPFGLSWLKRPEDFYINSKRYRALELSLIMGTINDLFTGATTDSVVMTVDIILVQSQANIAFKASDPGGKYSLPHKIPYFKHMPTIDPLAIQYWDLESNVGFKITDFFLSIGGDATPGVPYSGTPEDNLQQVIFQDNVHTYIDQATPEFFQQLRKSFLGADLPGLYPYTFIPNGSYKEAYKTVQKSDLKLKWLGITSDPPDQADLVLVGYREPNP